MNLLKQPLLAGNSGSGRNPKVKNEDWGGRGGGCDTLAVWMEKKHPRVKSTSSSSRPRLLLGSIAPLLHLYSPPSLSLSLPLPLSLSPSLSRSLSPSVCASRSPYHLHIKFSLKQARLAEQEARCCQRKVQIHSENKPTSEHEIRKMDLALSSSSSEL